MLTIAVRHKNIIRIAQSDAHVQADLWKIFFHNGQTNMAKLTGDSYRSRWWLILSFQLLNQQKTYSIAISRFSYPPSTYRKLSAYLWFYV